MWWKKLGFDVCSVAGTARATGSGCTLRLSLTPDGCTLGLSMCTLLPAILQGLEALQRPGSKCAGGPPHRLC